MKFNQSLQELQYKRAKKFILTGDETYLKDIFIESIINLNSNCRILKYYPGEEEEAKNALYASNMFDDDQLIILHYYDEMNKNGFKNIIPDYAGFLVVMISEEANIRNASISDMVGMCVNVQCTKMSEYGPDYPAWILTRASKKDYNFIDGADDLLYKKIGPDMFMLSKELEKLFLYKDHTKVIDSEDIEKVVINSAESSNYQILEGLLRKDIIEVLKAVKYYEDENIIELVNFLGHYFEKLYKMIVYHESKMSVDEISEMINIPSFIIKKKYLPCVVSLGRNRIESLIAETCSLIYLMRTSSIKKYLLDKFIMSFT